MKTMIKIFYILALAALATPFCIAQNAPKNELGFTLGGITSLSRSNSQPTLDLSAGEALGVSYGRRICGGKKVALYGGNGSVGEHSVGAPEGSSDLTCNLKFLFGSFATIGRFVTPRTDKLPTSAAAADCVPGPSLTSALEK